MRCSLWLLPPASVGNDWRGLIDELSAEGRGASSVPFEPHVTIVGGIQCDDPTELCRDLQEALRGRFVKGIDCQFLDRTVSMRRDGTVQWNQALVAVAERTQSLIELVDACLTFFERPLEPKFAPMICEPHFSLYYGTENVPDPETVVLRQGFKATELALWKTEPGTVAGVAEWREVGRIRLL
ncbi:hypothetical protein MHU86_14467 [Fragilaria crotonensis]|nr:hypothetical protein MHU86_14467 [Fragilaria crotonensis]